MILQSPVLRRSVTRERLRTGDCKINKEKRALAKSIISKIRAPSWLISIWIFPKRLISVKKQLSYKTPGWTVYVWRCFCFMWLSNRGILSRSLIFSRSPVDIARNNYFLRSWPHLLRSQPEILELHFKAHLQPKSLIFTDLYFKVRKKRQ